MTIRAVKNVQTVLYLYSFLSETKRLIYYIINIFFRISFYIKKVQDFIYFFAKIHTHTDF